MIIQQGLLFLLVSKFIYIDRLKQTYQYFTKMATKNSLNFRPISELQSATLFRFTGDSLMLILVSMVMMNLDTDNKEDFAEFSVFKIFR